MRTDGYQTCHGDHFIMCLSIESLNCTPENNTICTSSIFQQNKTATKKNLKEAKCEKCFTHKDKRLKKKKKRNCHSHQHQGKIIQQLNDYDSVKAQMMVSICYK